MARNAAGNDGLRLFQVAISSRNVLASQRWYADGLGMRRSKMLDIDAYVSQQQAEGALPDDFDMSRLQGIPVPVKLSLMGWAVDQQDFFQMELFQYSEPPAKPKPAAWRPCDIGYSMLCVHVGDFDATLSRLSALGSPPLAAQSGEPGRRRAAVFDPDGVLVEIMEDDPRTPEPTPRAHLDISAAARAVRLSVRDIDASVRFFVETVGMTVASAGTELHTAADEALWNLPGASRKIALLYCGDFWIELVQYTAPVGSDRPQNYLLCDQGLLNIAVGSRHRSDYLRVRDAVRAAGHRLSAEANMEYESCVYSFDDQGFCLEITYMGVEMDEIMGFVPAPL
jgi:catechol 2,3-dioxygenase-like lactoylglutathione lyase family enzyme